MCRAKNEGGRRCALHHPVTNAVKAVHQELGGYEPFIVNHAFSVLNKQGKSNGDWTLFDYKVQLDNLGMQVQNSVGLDESTRQQLLKRIAKAKNFEQTPPDSAVYAYFVLPILARNNTGYIFDRLYEYSARTGISFDDAWSKFCKMHDEIVVPRNLDTLPPLITKPENAQVNIDPKSQYLLAMMDEEEPVIYEQTRRIVHEQVQDTFITSMGYDPEDGRVEFATPSGIYAFHSLSPEDFEEGRSTPGRLLSRLDFSEDHQYLTADDELKDAFRMMCHTCEQFRIASGHVCIDGRRRGGLNTRGHDVDEVYASVAGKIADIPYAGARAPSWVKERDQRAKIHLIHPVDYGGYHAPDLTDVGAELQAGNVVIVDIGIERPLNMLSSRKVMVRTPVQLYTDQGNGRAVIVSDGSLECECRAYLKNKTCKHITYVENNNRLMSEAFSQFSADMFREQQISLVSSTENEDRVLVMKPTGENWYGTEQDGESSRLLSFTELEDIRYKVEEDVRKKQATGDAYTPVVLRVATDVPDENGTGIRTAEIEIFPDMAAHLRHTVVLNGERAGNVSWDDWDTGRMYVRQIKDHLTSHNIPQRLREQSDALSMLSWETVKERREAQLARFTGAEGYLKKPDEFLDDYQYALDRKDEPLSFVTGSVGNGNLSTVEGQGRGFGVEIEFDDGDMETIAQALADAGIGDGQVYDYHENDDTTAWRMTRDSSVSGGEIVSRILYDTEQSWSELESVCRIAKEHGATVSMRTGGHVHIGVDDPSTKRGVIAAAAAHQDVIRRLSTNPECKEHRSATDAYYTQPFNDTQLNTLYSSRGAVDPHKFYRTNMVNIGDSSSPTVEFRDPDGTLDPGHIQAQVMLSAALVAAAERGQWDDLSEQNWSMQKIGGGLLREKHVKEAYLPSQGSQRALASNVSLMTTLDALFPDRESKRRMLDLAARVPWQRPQ